MGYTYKYIYNYPYTSEQRDGDDPNQGSYDGENENNQIGLINNNIQANLNVSVFDSGAAASGISLLGAGTAAAAGTGTAAAAGTAGTALSAGAAAELGTTTLGAGLGGAGSAAGSTAWIPVVGQIVAVVAAIVGVGQMLETARKQQLMQKQINNYNQLLIVQQQNITIQTQAIINEINFIIKNIELREEALSRNKMMLIASVTVVGVSGMVLTYLATRK
jgi:hypothetical protein